MSQPTPLSFSYIFFASCLKDETGPKRRANAEPCLCLIGASGRANLWFGACWDGLVGWLVWLRLDVDFCALLRLLPLLLGGFAFSIALSWHHHLILFYRNNMESEKCYSQSCINLAYHQVDIISSDAWKKKFLLENESSCRTSVKILRRDFRLEIRTLVKIFKRFLYFLDFWV